MFEPAATGASVAIAMALIEVGKTFYARRNGSVKFDVEDRRRLRDIEKFHITGLREEVERQTEILKDVRDELRKR